MPMGRKAAWAGISKCLEITLALSGTKAFMSGIHNTAKQVRHMWWGESPCNMQICTAFYRLHKHYIYLHGFLTEIGVYYFAQGGF